MPSICTLKGINAIDIILSQYKKKSKIIDLKGKLPQTVIGNEESTYELIDSSQSKGSFSGSSTKITDASVNSDGTNKKPIYFLDAHKTKVKLWANMIDFANVNNGLFTILPPFTSIECWQCSKTFKTSPMGCPLKLHKILPTDKKLIDKLKKSNLHLAKDFFETEGIFCSTPCMKTYIKIMIVLQPTRYKESYTLLTLLQLRLFGKVEYIPYAPNWRLLKEKGGHLDRKSTRLNSSHRL